MQLENHNQICVERQSRSVRMTFEIQKGNELSRGTRAAVRLRTLLGKKFVDLQDPGTGPVMPHGYEIPRARTVAVTDLDEVVTSFDQTIAHTDVDALNRLIRSSDEIVAGRGDQIGAILTDAERLITAMAARKADIDRLITAGDRLTAAVADRQVALGASVDGLSLALDALSARKAELTQLVSGVEGLTKTLTPLLQRNEGALDGILADLVETVRVLDRQQARLDLALDQLPEAVNSLVKVTRQGSWLVAWYSIAPCFRSTVRSALCRT